MPEYLAGVYRGCYLRHQYQFTDSQTSKKFRDTSFLRAERKISLLHSPFERRLGFEAITPMASFDIDASDNDMPARDILLSFSIV